jgi:hypothetical protein
VLGLIVVVGALAFRETITQKQRKSAQDDQQARSRPENPIHSSASDFHDNRITFLAFIALRPISIRSISV